MKPSPSRWSRYLMKPSPSRWSRYLMKPSPSRWSRYLMKPRSTDATSLCLSSKTVSCLCSGHACGVGSSTGAAALTRESLI